MEDFKEKLRKLGEKHYGNKLYGDHLVYQHELQALIATHEKQLISKFGEIIGEDLPLGKTTGEDRKIRKAINFEKQTMRKLTKSIERGE